MFRKSNSEEDFLRIYITNSLTCYRKPQYLVFSDKKSKRVPAMIVMTGKQYVMDTSNTLLLLRLYSHSPCKPLFLLSTMPVTTTSDHIPI